MTRILVFGLGTGIGGIGTFMMNLYRNIEHSEIQFGFVIPGNDAYLAKEIEQLGGEIYYITPKKDNVLKNISDLFNVLRKCRNKYDIIYFNLSALYYNLPFIFSKVLGYQLVISHAHTSEPKKSNKNLRYFLHILNRKIVAKNSDYLFSCSNDATKWVFGDNDYVKEKTVIIPNGIDVKKYSYNVKTRKNMRDKLGITENDFVVGHVGRFSFEKNHVFLLDVFNEINKHRINSKLLLIGDGTNKLEIKDKIIDLGLEDRVIMTGARSDIPELLNAMDVFVFPSFVEGFGIALIEAQTTGLLAFATKNSVPEEVNVTGNVKFIELSVSPEKWATEILNSVDISKRIDMRGTVRQSGYDVINLANKFQNFIRSISRSYSHD